MYCNSPILTRTRDYCHGKIETAVQDLYDFACSLEYDMPLSEALRLSTLQEKLEQAAMDTEKQEKLIVQNAHLVLEARERNVAIHRLLLKQYYLIDFLHRSFMIMTGFLRHSDWA